MLHLLNPWMLLGLLAIVVPIGIHLLHRYRVRTTPFAGMRFLDQVMVRLQRKLRWQDSLLLFLRCVTLCLLALALCQPIWRSQQDFSKLLERSGATAAVLLFDNSASSRKQLPELKKMAHAYINTLRSGDAISIISLNNKNIQTIYDFSTAHLLIDRIEATDLRSDLSLLFQDAEQALRQHVNPHTEIIIVSDGQQSAWSESAFSQLNQLVQSDDPEENNTRCVVLAPKPDLLENNSSIRLLRSTQQVIAVGQRCLFSLAIQHLGAVPQHQCLVRIRADGRVIDERIINRKPDVEEIIHFDYVFSEPGSHVISAELVGLRDAIPSDNIRHSSVAVTDRIPVLLIDHYQGKQLRYVSMALNASPDQKSTFNIKHIDITNISADTLAPYPVVILADTAALDSQSIAVIERYIVGGGNMLVWLGPKSQASIINALWSRNGDGFLPCNIGEQSDINQHISLYPQCKDPKHPIFANLPANKQQLFSACNIYSYMPMDITHAINDPQFQLLMTINNGEAFLVERQRGQGRVLLCASNPNGHWSDLGAHAIFVPWMRGLCSYLSSFLLPPRNLSCGGSIIHLHQGNDSIHMTDAQGNRIQHQRSTWQGHQVSTSDPIWHAGIYQARQQQQRTWYAINVPHEEQLIEKVSQTWLQEQNPKILLLQQENDIKQSWGQGADNATPLWQIVIICCMLLLVLEMFYTRYLGQGSTAHAK